MGAPALAGLPAGVIIQALTQMARGQGGNAIMQSIAQTLSPAERQAVAVYFAGLQKP
jgi:cytochrome c553